jgi:DNA invertase Pin-like site-specific DNA recombinase
MKSATPAVIYCRVSSSRQVKEGDGLTSQETRCREFARGRGYWVVAVFRDEGVSGSIVARPAMKKMLAFLRKSRSQQHFVIIDDINRLARNIEAHLKLRATILSAGGKLVSPSIEFGEGSDSVLVEHMLASVAQHQREKNTEQSLNRMRARLMNGYWVFKAPVGYRYELRSGRGKILIRDEPNASTITEVLEGFAAGRFETLSEVQHHLRNVPSYPRSIGLQHIHDLLTRPLYAGYFAKPDWRISWTQGKHEPLISFEIFQRVQDRLNGRAKAPARKDLSRDFPLRGFVTCSSCGRSMTAAWSAGRSAKYPYYSCNTRGCSEYRASIRKEKLEGEFETLLSSLQPTHQTLDVAKGMLCSLWQDRERQAASERTSLESRIAQLDRKIQQVMARIIDSSAAELISLYEGEIRNLQAQKILLTEQIAKIGQPQANFDQTFRTAVRFLANPSELWRSGDLNHQRIVLRLAFATKLLYSRSDGFRTAEINLPFRLATRSSV